MPSLRQVGQKENRETEFVKEAEKWNEGRQERHIGQFMTKQPRRSNERGSSLNYREWKDRKIIEEMILRSVIAGS